MCCLPHPLSCEIMLFNVILKENMHTNHYFEICEDANFYVDVVMGRRFVAYNVNGNVVKICGDLRIDSK